MPQKLLERIDSIYRYVQRAQQDQDLRSRVCRRQEEVLRVELVGVDQARLFDLNVVVASVVAEALPVCRSLGVSLRVWQAADLPPVPLLVEPMQHTLAGLIDLCLDEERVEALELRTWSELDCVVASVERRVNGAGGDDPHACWRELAPGARLELLVGAQALRALGGALSMRSRGRQLVCRVEIPRGANAMPLGDGHDLSARRPQQVTPEILQLNP